MTMIVTIIVTYLPPQSISPIIITKAFRKLHPPGLKAFLDLVLQNRRCDITFFQINLYLITEHNVKTETKGDYEDEQQEPELGDRLEDLEEHDDEDPELYGELRQVRGQVKPGACNQE